jgi:chorismate mutase
MKVRGIRGAVQVAENTPEQIGRAAVDMVSRMARENDVKPVDVAYVYFTVTQDLMADFPARSIRTSLAGWEFVPLLCSQEIAVLGMMPRLLRVLMLVNTELEQHEIRHAYVGEATKLRPDLGAKT